jgi:hypothetical protein
MNACTLSTVFRALPVVGTLALVTFGCSSGGSSGPSPFNGTWSCTQTTTYNYTVPANTAPQSTTKSLEVVLNISNGDPLVFASTPTDAATVGDAGAGCTLTFSTAGSAGNLEPNQSCTVSLARNGATATYTLDFTTGSASVSGNALTVQTASTFTATLADMAGSLNYKGNSSGTTMCTK